MAQPAARPCSALLSLPATASWYHPSPHPPHRPFGTQNYVIIQLLHARCAAWTQKFHNANRPLPTYRSHFHMTDTGIFGQRIVSSENCFDERGAESSTCSLYQCSTLCLLHARRLSPVHWMWRVSALCSPCLKMHPC